MVAALALAADDTGTSFHYLVSGQEAGRGRREYRVVAAYMSPKKRRKGDVYL